MELLCWISKNLAVCIASSHPSKMSDKPLDLFIRTHKVSRCYTKQPEHGKADALVLSIDFAFPLSVEEEGHEEEDEIYSC